MLQRKLASVISALSGSGEPGDRDGGLLGEEDDMMGGVRSPDAYEPPEGIDGGFTAYANGGGGASAWGASAATPYGATSYGGGYGF